MKQRATPITATGILLNGIDWERQPYAAYVHTNEVIWIADERPSWGFVMEHRLLLEQYGQTGTRRASRAGHQASTTL